MSDTVLAAQTDICVKCGLCLTFPVCVTVTCRTFNVNRIHSGTFCNTFDKVNSGNNTALQTELFFKVIKLRFCTLAPYPY